MARTNLRGFKVAFLTIEQSELLEPRRALQAVGADRFVVSPQTVSVRSWNDKQWGEHVAVDQILESADPHDYDALVLPGGVMNPDALRMQPKAVAFVKAFFDAGKPVGAIYQGPWTVIEGGAARGHRMTSWPSLKTDVRNAGGDWVDEEVVVDQNLVTSRKPDDIPAFNREMINLFKQYHTAHA